MKIRVGAVEYDVRMVNGPVLLNGRECFGLCDPDGLVILIDGRMNPARRVATFWHELAHAWKFELDVHDTKSMQTEAMCSLIGLAMASMDVRTIAKIHVFLTQQMDAHDVLLLSGCREPVPVIRLGS